MIVITGAAGFIGSSMVRHLNESGRSDLVLVDNFPVMPVETCHGASLHDVKFLEKIPRDFLFDWLSLNQQKLDFIIHLGSEIDTLPENTACFQEKILEFSQRLWSFAAMNRIPLLFAASSTEDKWYWTGHEWTVGENLQIAEAERLKRQFDQWVLKQRITPPLWAGFAVPEVYGPNESHLGDAASSVFQLFRQWQKEGRVVIPLYENSESSDNEPLLDRIFVKDVVTVFTWFINHLPASGFYYLGTGYPRPLSTVAATLFSVLKQLPQVEYQLISSEIPYSQNRNLEMFNKINRVGYKKNFTPLEKGIRLYLKKYLSMF